MKSQIENMVCVREAESLELCVEFGIVCWAGANEKTEVEREGETARRTM